MSASPLSARAETVRRFDRDAYLVCLFAPAAQREAFFSLFAFNIEVAKTAEVVSEPMLGQIRLQWWREAIGDLAAGRPPRHDAIVPLARPLAEGRLTGALFERMIDAREGDLEPTPPPSLAALEAYAEATSGGLIQLLLELLDGRDEAARRVAGHVGIARALGGLLRAVPFHARQNRIYLPRDLLDNHAVRRDDLLRLRPSEGLDRTVAAVAEAAERHLAAARAAVRDVPRGARPALLPAAIARRDLASLSRAGYNPLDARVQQPRPDLVWRLAWARLSGRI